MNHITNCTLFVIDCIQPELAVKALEKTCEQLTFKEVTLFSHEKPHNFNNNFKFIKIDKINSLEQYSEFMIYKLADYINTEFCFSIHCDGFVIRPDLWSNEYLEYDYIGAPWRKDSYFIVDNNRVGNGGVSIRSKKLMEYVKTIPNLKGNEDVLICSTLKNSLEKQGFKFAPLDLASSFSVEHVCDDLLLQVGDTFAFHGKNTERHLHEIRQLLQSYYRDDLIKMSKNDLKSWIRNKAGSQQPDYFLCNTPGNLQLQQIPEEYSELLDILRTNDIKTYLELGVGNGGSFFVNSIFLQRTANTLHCVDNIAYRETHIKQTEVKIQTKVDKLKDMFNDKDITFFNDSTDGFFDKNKNKYDCIFIDADHSYEGVKADYNNSKKFINEKGIIILHDIANIDTGVAQLWSEIKAEHTNIKEFSYRESSYNRYNCGIGAIFL